MAHGGAPSLATLWPAPHHGFFPHLPQRCSRRTCYPRPTKKPQNIRVGGFHQGGWKANNLFDPVVPCRLRTTKLRWSWNMLRHQSSGPPNEQHLVAVRRFMLDSWKQANLINLSSSSLLLYHIVSTCINSFTMTTSFLLVFCSPLAPLKIPQLRLSHFQQLVPSLLSLVPGMPFRILLEVATNGWATSKPNSRPPWHPISEADPPLWSKYNFRPPAFDHHLCSLFPVLCWIV